MSRHLPTTMINGKRAAWPQSLQDLWEQVSAKLPESKITQINFVYPHKYSPGCTALHFGFTYTINHRDVAYLNISEEQAREALRQSLL